jgi:hypothetical protein
VHAGRLVVAAGVNLLARLRRGVAREHERTALHAAAVLAARNDLLARITALLEVHATDHFQVHHLRHELLDRRGDDARHGALHLEPLPGAERQGGQIGCRRAGPQRTCLAMRVGQPNQRAVAPPRRDDRGGRGADDTPQRPFRARVAQAAFGAQHEHAQALQRGGQDIGAARQQVLVRSGAPDDEGRKQPALGRAVAGQARLAQREAGDVLRQLAVQEARGIRALRAHHAPVGQGAGAVRKGRVHAPIIIIVMKPGLK